MGQMEMPDPDKAGRLAFVNRKQESLHRYGVEGAMIRNVYQLLGTPAWLRTALDRVLSHTGSRSPGTDGKTRDDYQTEDAKALLVSEIVAAICPASQAQGPTLSIVGATGTRLLDPVLLQ